MRTRLSLPLRIAPAILMLAALGCPNSGGGGVSQDVLNKETDTFNLVNNERTKQGIGTLAMDADLRELARDHSQDMVDRNFFSHTNPDNKDPFDRLQAAGISYNIAAENIQWNNYPDPVQTAVTSWMNSSGHRANILDARFTETGVGVADAGGGTYYFTQVFIGTSKDVPVGYVEVYYYEPEADERE